jgi:hypothetical protein
VWLTCRAAWSLLVARAILALWPGRALAPRGGARRLRAGRRTPAELAAAVQRAARYLPMKTSCLVLALALERLLRSEGLDGTVVLGVRRIEDTIHAHAWVEHEGVMLIGAPPASTYLPLHRTRSV